MKKEQEINAYEPPQVEVIEVEVEKGFTTSDGTGGQNMTPTTGSW